MNLTEQMNIHHQRIKLAVCKLISISEDSYCTMQYECGLKYLELLYPIDPRRRDMMERSKEFWSWWRCTWASYDLGYLESVTENEPIEDRIDWYEKLHSAYVLYCEIKPNRVVVESINQRLKSAA
ncbi:MAG TPA: hypothetical protein PLU07_07150 [Ferruginibacter sp.]|nr:hypothetical protein [Ferruginibacter sp.]HRO17948.1 hypothetical protein [Ferruginibacter sp.]